MKKALLILLTGWLAQAQAQTTEFFKYYGKPTTTLGRGMSISKLSDGSLISAYIVADIDQLGVNQRDIFLVRIKTNGDTIWTRKIADPSKHEAVGKISITNDDKIIVPFSVANVTGGNTDFQLAMACMDSGGNLLWNKTYQRGGQNFASAAKVVSDGILLAGFNVESTDANACLLKTSFGGDSVWYKSIGGIDDEAFADIAETPDGGYMLVGDKRYAGGGLDRDIWLLKMDSGGNEIWNTTFGAPVDIDYATAITAIKKKGVINGYAITGARKQDPNYFSGDIFFVKVDTGGKLVWDKSFPNPDTWQIGMDIAQLNDGGFIIGGLKYLLSGFSESYIIKTDNDGDIVWEQEHPISGESVSTRGITEGTDGNYYCVGDAFDLSQMKLFTMKVSDKPTSVSQLVPPAAMPPITVSPNPATDKFVVSTVPGDAITFINIFSIDGKLLQSIMGNHKGRVTVYTAGLNADEIIIRVQTERYSASIPVLIRY